MFVEVPKADGSPTKLSPTDKSSADRPPKSMASSGPDRASTCKFRAFTARISPVPGELRGEKSGERDLNSSSETPSILLQTQSSIAAQASISDAASSDLPRTSQGHLWKPALEQRVQAQKNSWRKLFNIPDDEEYVDEFICALQKGFLIQGRLYVFSRHVCFFATIFGYSKILVIPLTEIVNVNKERTLGLPTSISFFTQKGKKHLFTSFLLNRDECYATILHTWNQASDYARLAKGSEVDAIARRSRPSRLSTSDATKRDIATAASLPSTPVQDFAELPPPPPVNSNRILSDEELEEAVPEETAPGSMIWEPKDLDPPTPEGATVVFDLDFPCSARTFLLKVLQGYDEMQRTMAAENIEMGQWNVHPVLGHVRDFRFRSKIRGKVTFGYTHTDAVQTQRYVVYRGDKPGLFTIVFETSQTNLNIPYGDAFTVHTQIFVTDLGPGKCKVEAHLTVPFSKKVMFKSVITSQTIVEVKDFFEKNKRLMIAKTRPLRVKGSIFGGDTVLPAFSPLEATPAKSILERMSVAVTASTLAHKDKSASNLTEQIEEAAGDATDSPTGTGVKRCRAKLVAWLTGLALDNFECASDCTILRLNCWKWGIMDMFDEVRDQVVAMPIRDRVQLFAVLILVFQALFILVAVVWSQPRHSRNVTRRIEALQDTLLSQQEDMRRVLDLISLALVSNLNGNGSAPAALAAAALNAQASLSAVAAAGGSVMR